MTTTDNSRADALTDERILEIAETIGVRDAATDDVLVNLVRACLAESTTSQPAAAPIDWCDTMERPKSQCGCPDCGSSLIDLGPGLRNTAPPSPADERAATFEWWLESLSPRRRALIGDVRDARMGWEASRAASATVPRESDDPEVIAAANRGYAAGLADGKVLGALASANETGAEGTTERDLTRTIDERDQMEEMGTRLANAVGEFLGVDVGEWSSVNNPILAAIEALESRSPAMAAEAVAQWQYRTKVTTGVWSHWHNCKEAQAQRLQEPEYASFNQVRALYAAPQPAQADAREGLTAEMRVAIQECIDYLRPAAKEFADLDMGDSKHARCIRTLRALLAAHPGQLVPRAEVTFSEWFELEYPMGDGGSRPKYRATNVLDLMISAWNAARTGASS